MVKSKTDHDFGECGHSQAFADLSIQATLAPCRELLKYQFPSQTLPNALKSLVPYILGTQNTPYFNELTRFLLYCIPCYSSYSYKIHSNTSRSGFEAGAHSVVRRYSDFTWLSQELSKEFPGVIVPPLPEKLTVGRFGEEFVDSRRRGLERFLHRIASHAELSNSQYFIVFLQAAESGLAEAKNESKSSSKSKSGTTIGWLEGTVNNLTTGAKVRNCTLRCFTVSLFTRMSLTDRS